MFKKQSAFSLIEVLVALMLLSLGIVTSGKVVLDSTVCSKKTSVEEGMLLLSTTIAESLRVRGNEKELATQIQDWRQKAKALFSQSELLISQKVVEGLWVYTVELSFGVASVQTIAFRVVV